MAPRVLRSAILKKRARRERLDRDGRRTGLRRADLFAEALEARVLLSIATWDGGAGTNSWFDKANWSGDVLPGATDDVSIDAGTPGGSTVTLASGTATINSLQSAKALNITGGSLSIAATSTITTDLTLSSGTLSGAGALTVGGTLSWSGGTMTGTGTTTVAAGGTLAISGTNVKDLATRTLVNAGTASWSGTGRLRTGSGAAFRNNGMLDLQGDVTISNDLGGAQSALVNAGACASRPAPARRRSASPSTAPAASTCETGRSICPAR
jgi:hypothetical protein